MCSVKKSDHKVFREYRFSVEYFLTEKPSYGDLINSNNTKIIHLSSFVIKKTLKYVTQNQSIVPRVIQHL